MRPSSTLLKPTERRAILGTAVLAMLLLVAAGARAGGPISLRVTPSCPHIGDALLIEARADADVHTVGVSFLGRSFHLHPETNGHFRGLAPVGLLTQPGPKRLRLVGWSEDGSRRSMEVVLQVSDRRFENHSLEVGQEFTAPSRSDRKRIARDRERLARAWRNGLPEPLFDERFIAPVNSRITGEYGTRRLFNGELKSRHRGVDLDGRVGDLASAANRGRVVLAEQLYYSGGTVILDHGARLYTVYFHLSRIDVKPGELVQPGETLGAIGATGRVTGPHLHWGARLRGTYVNPLALAELPLGDGAIDGLALR